MKSFLFGTNSSANSEQPLKSVIKSCEKYRPSLIPNGGLGIEVEVELRIEDSDIKRLGGDAVLPPTLHTGVTALLCQLLLHRR